MSMTPQTPNDAFYMSAPASPKRINLEGLCFYSVPTSPKRNSRQVFEDSSYSNVDDEFEFETSRRYNVDEYEFESEAKSEDKESLPAMAFADELFSDGKLVMPLKPPPRLQYNKLDKQSSTLSSPRSPTGVLKLPFQRRSLWNDDFDPFMVALENVKKDKVRKSPAKCHRRARSMSPFREISPKGTNDLSGSSQQQINQMGLILPTLQSERMESNGSPLKQNHGFESCWESSSPFGTRQQLNSELIRIPIWLSDTRESRYQKKMEGNGSAFLMWQISRQEQEKQVKRKPIDLAEPKGVVFARRARLVKAGHEIPRRTNAIIPTVEAKESGVTCTKETKSQRIKKLLFRSASMRNIINEDKPKSSNATESKANITKKSSFKSIGLTRYNEEKRVSQVTKMTLIQYRPKLLLCMGYGSKCVQ